MALHRHEHTLGGALAAIAAIAVAVGVLAAPASAAPGAAPPPVSGTPLQQYQQLSQQASDLNNKLQNAQVDLTAKNHQLDQANSDLAGSKKAYATAQAQQNAVRGQVDQALDASFEGAQFNQLSALLTGTSTRDFLDRATTLSDMATDNSHALNTLAGAVRAAQTAQQRAQSDQQEAQDATNAANALVAQIKEQQSALNAQISQVKAAADKLSAADEKTIHDIGPPVKVAPPAGSGSGGGKTGSPPPPAGGASSGVRGAAMQVALSKRGSEYVWGASGPSTFDCSGLVMWSYAREGVSLPHSSQAQSAIGTLISSRSALQPGDLVFFGGSGSIHHVGIYVGNGQMVDAPDTGSVVRVENLFSDYAWGRRIGG